jgi:Na+/H+ antiporter NhaC
MKKYIQQVQLIYYIMEKQIPYHTYNMFKTIILLFFFWSSKITKYILLSGGLKPSTSRKKVLDLCNLL